MRPICLIEIEKDSIRELHNGDITNGVIIELKDGTVIFIHENRIGMYRLDTLLNGKPLDDVETAKLSLMELNTEDISELTGGPVSNAVN